MQAMPALVFGLLLAFGVASQTGVLPLGVFTIPKWLGWSLASIGGGLLLHEGLGRPVPFLRLSFLRMALGMKNLLTEGQVGDSREKAVVEYVEKMAPAGDVNAAINAIDTFAYKHKFLMNVGDKKGLLLDAVVDRVKPKHAIEVGAYIGYSALRIAKRLPEGGHLFSVEFSAKNAALTRRVLEHAGLTAKVTVITGTLGDGGETLATIKKKLIEAAFDLVFLDHDKDVYVPDLKCLLDSELLHVGSVVVADNVGFPGAPEYRKYMKEREGGMWKTIEHKTKVEYQSIIPDLVLESTLLRST